MPLFSSLILLSINSLGAAWQPNQVSRRVAVGIGNPVHVGHFLADELAPSFCPVGADHSRRGASKQNKANNQHNQNLFHVALLSGKFVYEIVKNLSKSLNFLCFNFVYSKYQFAKFVKIGL